MKALISPNEILTFPNGITGVRVACVSSEEFPVAPPFFWVACEPYVTQEDYYWDGEKIQLEPQEVGIRNNITTQLGAVEVVCLPES